MQDDLTELKRLMDDRGLTQAAAARFLGVSQPTIHRTLKGEGVRTGPARRRISKALAHIQNNQDEYSSFAVPQDLLDKLVHMCEQDGDAAVLDALLDAVAAYRRRAGE